MPTPYFDAAADGRTQLRRHWPAENPKAAVLLVHGLGEHTGRYEHVGAYLAERGYDVLGADNRGFGQTAGTRAHVTSFREFTDDVAALLVERRSLGVPVVLLGHSLGGLISAAYLASSAEQPDLAILSAPALDAELPAWKRRGAPIIAKVKADLFVPNTIEAHLLSRVPEVQQAYVDDPLVIAGATAGLGAASLRAMDYVRANVENIQVPTYVLHGDLDTVVPTVSSKVLERLPNVTRRVWPGLLHECFNEPEQNEVMGEMVDWLDEQLS